MKSLSTKALLSLFFTLILTACGSSDSSSAVEQNIDVNTTYTINNVAQFLETGLEGMDGNESTGSLSGDVNGMAYSVDYLGSALCLPADPYAEPQPYPDPLNVYGCQNDLTVAYNDNHAGLEVTFDATVPVLFADIETWSELTGTDQGYVTGDATITMTFALIANDDGSYSLDPAITPVIELSLFNLSLHSEDALVEALASDIMNAVSTVADDQLTAALETYTAQIVQNGLADISFFF